MIGAALTGYYGVVQRHPYVVFSYALPPSDRSGLPLYLKTKSANIGKMNLRIIRRWIGYGMVERLQSEKLNFVFVRNSELSIDNCRLDHLGYADAKVRRPIWVGVDCQNAYLWNA